MQIYFVRNDEINMFNHLVYYGNLVYSQTFHVTYSLSDKHLRFLFSQIPTAKAENISLEPKRNSWQYAIKRAYNQSQLIIQLPVNTYQGHLYYRCATFPIKLA